MNSFITHKVSSLEHHYDIRVCAHSNSTPLHAKDVAEGN